MKLAPDQNDRIMCSIEGTRSKWGEELIIVLIFAIMKELLDLGTKDGSLAALCLTVSPQRIARAPLEMRGSSVPEREACPQTIPSNFGAPVQHRWEI
jgi:hypothetical protein